MIFAPEDVVNRRHLSAFDSPLNVMTPPQCVVHTRHLHRMDARACMLDQILVSGVCSMRDLFDVVYSMSSFKH